MKKQNDIIKNIEATAERLGGTVRVTRFSYIKEAIVEATFGSSTNLMVNIGPRGGIKYCSWFLTGSDGDWSVHYDDKRFTGKRNGAEVGRFFNLMQTHAVKEAA